MLVNRDKQVLHDKMKKAVKEKAISILKLDQKFKDLGDAIDKGDTNLFFLEMFGKEVMLNAKLIMSLQTAFGMSFYEQISKTLGTQRWLGKIEQHYK